MKTRTSASLFRVKPNKSLLIVMANILWIWLLPGLNRVAAQDQKKSDSSPLTTRYIVHLDTIVSLKLNLNTEYERFEQRFPDNYYDIRPNISLSTKIAFSYRYVSFGFGFKPRFIPGNNDNAMQGKTKAISFGLDISTRHWQQSLQFGYIRGFYLHNTGDIEPEWVEGDDPYLLLPDLKVAYMRGSTGYKVNPNFSLKAINSKTEIQLKSCGSFIPAVTYNYYETDNQSSDTAQKSSQYTSNFEAGLSLAYAYTLVLGSKFYISGGIAPGFGWHHTKLVTRYPDENLITRYNNPQFRIMEKAAIGYNTPRFFAGGELSLMQSSYKETNNLVQNRAKRVYYQVFVGYRFQSPKFLKRQVDVVKEKAPKPIRHFLK
jgi:hypothetical protein